MKRTLLFSLLAVAAASIFPWVIKADGSEAGVSTPAPQGLEPLVLVGIAVILIVAKLSGELFERFGQPTVLGELIGGIVIGNLALLNFGGLEFLKANGVISALAQIGVVILLFEVGLESKIAEMAEVGWSSLAVAVVGVIAPFFLGWAVAAYFRPGGSQLEHIFIGAVLCATSVGITARVLKDTGQLGTREARIILGAAVIDDVLSLLILAVISGAITAARTSASLAVTDVLIIAFKSVAFLAGAILLGHFVVPRLFQGAGRLKSHGVLVTLAIAFCFLLAWVASRVGLAPIVGAFAAGLILDEAHFETFRDREEFRLEQLLRPISSLLVPIFFVLMGVKVDLRAFAQPRLLAYAGTLTLAAIIGKQVCSLAVLEKQISRFTIGFGMIPRGEVGLILAGIGATLILPSTQAVKEPVVGSSTFAAIVIMVISTTIITPPLLKWSLSRVRPSGNLKHEGDALLAVADEGAEGTSA